MKRRALVSAILVVAATFFGWAQNWITATVVYVVDGDTIGVVIAAMPSPAPAGLNVGQTVRVRYIGVDAPERDHPDGQAATDLNAILVQGKTVYLELDERQWHNGRLLAYVYLDPGGRLMVNLILVVTDIIPARTDQGTERYDHLFSYHDRPPSRCDPVIAWSEARARVGETLCVEGLVASVGTSAGGDVFLNLGLPFPNPGRFTLFIPAAYADRFEAKFGTEFWRDLRGTVVRAYGEVSLHREVSQIRLSNPALLFLKP